MPRYYFDVTDTGAATPDTVGVELIDDAEAREEAIGLASQISHESLPNGDRHEVKVAARNANGDIVYEATLSLDGRWRPGRR